MCGFTAIISNNSKIELAEIKKANKTISHRGPDNEGYWVNDSGNVALGHMRLSIIDLSENGSQPFMYKDRYAVVFNGEIYNYIELREELKLKGCHFTTDSDTEVLIALYDFYGSSFLNKLDGMFAFLIYDKLENKLFGARDRFGEKPFFYSFIDNKLVIASEIKAIQAIGGSRELNEEVVYRYITANQLYGGDYNDDTIFQGIKKLKRAHYCNLDIDENKLSIDSYWDINLEINNESITVENAVEQFTALFTKSIERRLRSDVKTGISLSGGLDSSCIQGAVWDKKLSKNIESFSVIFPNSPTDESAYQKIVGDHTGIKNHQISLGMNDYVTLFDDVLYHQDEPFGSTSIIAQFELYKKVKKEGVTVFIEGQGADEYLSGYNYFTHIYLREKLLKGQFFDFVRASIDCGKNQSKGLANVMGGALLTLMPGVISDKLPIWNNKQNLDNLSYDFRNKYQNLDNFEKSKMLNHKSFLYHESLNGGLENLLRFNDRNAMASAVEVRLPYLSHELVEFVFSLPAEFKINKGFSKWVLRKSYEKVLPSSIIWRKNKLGFRTHNLFLSDQKSHPLLVSRKNNRELKKYFSTNEGNMSDSLLWKKYMLGSLLNKAI
jgi:asparagine synthase (glutamine-hydrolysing)